MRLEALFRTVDKQEVRAFEMVDGNFATANVLAPEDLLLEKVSTYIGRSKVRDLYDIFFLTHLTRGNDAVREQVRKLLTNFRWPEDESVLRTLVVAGSVPTVKAMLETIDRWAG